MGAKQLSVLLFKDAELGVWVVQCLEHDIAAQGKTLDEVRDALNHILSERVALSAEAGKDLVAILPRAPERFWDAWRSGKGVDLPVQTRLVDVKLGDVPGRKTTHGLRPF